MEPERGLRSVLVISAILIAGILTKLDAAKRRNSEITSARLL